MTTPNDENHAQEPEPSISAYHRFRRLQTHIRSNIPALMAHRATSAFTLHDEPPPAEANERVQVMVFPQDPFIGEPEIRTMSATDIQHGLINSRIRVQSDKADSPAPDSDGNYLFWPNAIEFDQVNCFYYATLTLRMLERYARRALPWSFPSPRITISARAGAEANAYYSEQDRTLGFHQFAIDGNLVSAAQSADIVSHETAHAILDGLRDLYNESFGLGPNAFHESFGDIAAVLVALHDDSLVRRVLEWTGGDIRRPNFIAEVAEHLTKTLATVNGPPYLRGHTIYLRNAINGLVNREFDALPKRASKPETELSRDAHNFSRLFTGAFYDILAGVYERLHDDLPAHIAIYRARDIMGRLLLCAVEAGPVGEHDFSDIAHAFISADVALNDGAYLDIIARVFADRQILAETDAAAHIENTRNLPAITLPETINSAMASALFLEESVLQALQLPHEVELTPHAAYRNADGYAFLTYFSAESVSLSDPAFGAFENATLDVFGGLSLMFNPEGSLCSVINRPVLEEDIRQIKTLIRDLVADGRIVAHLLPQSIDSQNLLPEGLFLKDVSANDQLVRYPVTFDAIPDNFKDFVDYLKLIHQQKA